MRISKKKKNSTIKKKVQRCQKGILLPVVEATNKAARKKKE